VMYKLSSFLVLLLLSASIVNAQQITVSKENRTIAVTTDDTATADADTALVHIGFQNYATDEQTAYANASKVSNAIATALANAGVKKDAIESQMQSINRVQPFELQNLPPEQKGQRQFVAQQAWTVKTSAKDAAAVLDVAVKAGANSSGDIEWSVADPDALESQAAGKALKRAREIADRMAQGLGAKLGVLVYASNQAAQVHPLMQANVLNAAVSPMARKTIEPLAVNPRKVVRSATVYAVFSIE
jgi:uncharacterized protein